ncbi:MAG: class I SAM-dependent methyltransferase [candidate division Zixibacteria bacterium]|nr:class I SAM-dependent methyltransferase [candidate division Zixibacteria bacterium]
MKEASKEDEEQFFDRTYKFGARKPVSKFYTVVQSSRKYYEDFLFAHCRNKKVLEFGCGSGSYAFFLTRRGAKVMGIDISRVAIEQAKARACKEKMKDIEFLVMDAEEMQFEDDSFDMVYGTGILHHLRLHKALRELARVLNPEGKAIFIEPMAHNPAINLFRKLTPRFRTKDEHPLTAKDLERMKEFFHQANYDFFHLFSLFAVPFRNSKVFSSLLKTLDDLDRKLFEWVTWMRPLA